MGFRCTSGSCTICGGGQRRILRLIRIIVEACCLLFVGCRLLVVLFVVAVGLRENCFLRMSAYVTLVTEKTGLLRHRGRREDGGGSISDGIDFLIMFSRFSSIHALASGRLDCVVTTRHLFFATNSMRKNHDCLRRWS